MLSEGGLDFKIVVFKSEYQNQVLDVVGGGLKGLGVIPDTEEPLTDEDLYHIQEIYSGRGRFWVAIEEGRVIGTVAVKDMGNGRAKLKRMFVLDEHQGTGVGQALLDHALTFTRENGYKEVILNTHKLMKRAHRFYEKNGFERIGDDSYKYQYRLTF